MPTASQFKMQIPASGRYRSRKHILPDIVQVTRDRIKDRAEALDRLTPQMIRESGLSLRRREELHRAHQIHEERKRTKEKKRKREREIGLGL